MTVELLLPGRIMPAPKPPSRIALNMAFGVGAGAVLGDKSRYSSHGAITTATWAAGLHGYCLNFVPGNPDYVTIPAAHTQLNFTSEDFSIIARVNIDDLTDWRDIFLRGLHNTDGYQFYIGAAGFIYFATHQALVSQITRSSNGDIVTGNWYTIGASRSGASARTYRNGVDVTSVVGVHIDPLTCARSAKIGIYDDLAAGPLDGRMEFLRIFRGVALVASEHLAWHNALA